MTRTPGIAAAVALAASVHRDQRDKAGQPYILHPLRVMLKQADEPAQMVAVLHDMLEDSPNTDAPITAVDLRCAGYSEEVIAAGALTKREGERYEEFIERIALNSLARRAKLGDLEDNWGMPLHRRWDARSVRQHAADLTQNRGKPQLTGPTPTAISSDDGVRFGRVLEGRANRANTLALRCSCGVTMVARMRDDNYRNHAEDSVRVDTIGCNCDAHRRTHGANAW
jgi:hypothetical protein